MLDAFNDYARVQDTEETMVITVSAREEVEIFLRYAKANPSELDEQADRVLVNAFGAANKLRLGPKPKMPGYWPKEN